MYTELFNAVIPTLFSSFLLFCYPYTLYLFTWFFSTQMLFEKSKNSHLICHKPSVWAFARLTATRYKLLVVM